MKKLLFNIIRERLAQESTTAERRFLLSLMDDEVQKFLIDNVFMTLPEKTNLLEIPNIAPPYPKMWFEWDICPETDEKSVFFGADTRYGVYVKSESTPKGWEIIFKCFSYTNKSLNQSSLLLLEPLALKFNVSSDGHIPRNGLDITYVVTGSATLLSPSSNWDMLFDEMVPIYASPVLVALGLLHCKNIVQIEKGGKNPNIKNRRHRSKGTKHYILNVIPARNIKRTEYEQPANGSSQRIHFRRGHFKEYTSERPLFGKYVGAFWWEAHAAGNADIGEVKKDYRILPMQQ